MARFWGEVSTGVNTLKENNKRISISH